MSINSQIKILLVEDSFVTRKMEVETLKDLGFVRIIEAEDGEAADAILKKDKDIDLIISDWNMPVKDGYELLKQVRSDAHYGSVPFIMATAHGERKQASKAVEAGASNFITKPFDTSELNRVIKETIEKVTPQVSLVKGIKTQKIIDGKVQLKVAHIQITDHLTLGVMKHLIRTGQIRPRYFDMETICMPSWNPVQTAIERGEVDAAFILAPIAMDMFSFGVPVKLVIFAHKNGSICVRSKDDGSAKSLYEYFKGKTIFIPHILSIHHMLSNMFLRDIGLKPGLVGQKGVNVFFEVVPPIRMPEFMMKNPEARGFTVAEPLGAKTIASGNGELMFLSGELWENHPCCVVIMRDEIIDVYTDAVYEFVNAMVQAGKFILKNLEASAKIAVDFLDPDRKLGLRTEVLESVLKEPKGIRTDDLFPVIDDLDRIQQYMKNEMGIGTLVDLEKFVDLRFAEIACKLETSKQIFTPVTVTEKISLAMIADVSKSVFEMSSDTHSISFRMSSELRHIDKVIQETYAFLTKFEPDTDAEFEPVLRELLQNAICHGNQEVIKEIVQCNIIRLLKPLFQITVKDAGQGFDYQNIDTSIPDNPLNRIKGYAILNKFCERITFADNGSRVTAYVRISQKNRFFINTQNRLKIIKIKGDIKENVGSNLRTLLMALVKRRNKNFVFDLSGVENIDTSGIDAFSTLIKILDKDMPEIINASNSVLEIFRSAGLDKKLRVN